MSFTYRSVSLYRVHHDRFFVLIRPICELLHATASLGTLDPTWEHNPSHSLRDQNQIFDNYVQVDFWQTPHNITT